MFKPSNFSFLSFLSSRSSEKGSQESRLVADLIASKERLSLAVKAGRMGIWEYNLQTGQTYWDDNMFRLLELPRCSSEEISKFWIKNVAPSDLLAIDRRFQELIQHGKPFEFQFPFKIGSKTLHLHTMGSGVIESNGKIIRAIGVNRDITEEVEARQALESKRVRLLSAAKMASLGEMASNIAHEINNPLAIIVARIHQMRTTLEAQDIMSPNLQENLQKIESTAMRISKIIKSLRGFSRDASLDPFVVTPLRKIMDETLEICGLKFSFADIDIRVEIPDHIQLNCRPAELSQVFINLLNNSFYAVASQKNKKITIKAEDMGEFVQLRFTDSGPQISSEIRKRIMDPFFTTKPTGLGTGLGLTISKILVENHQGEIKLLDHEPQTTFIIRLPKIQSSHETSPALS